jgi:hypothetical protein
VEDEHHLRDVFAVLWPTNDYESDGQMKRVDGQAGINKASRARFRDAMHVATAIRYSGTGFVTEDGNMLKAAPRILSEFKGFTVLSIADATERSFEEVRRVRSGAEVMGRPEPTWLPDWP